MKEIENLQPSGPLLLGGYCHGATTAFELARQVQAKGRRVLGVVMLDPSPLMDEELLKPGQNRRELENPDLATRRRLQVEHHFLVCNAYRPQPLDVPLVLMLPVDDDDEKNWRMETWAEMGREVEVMEFSGHHQSFLWKAIDQLAPALATTCEQWEAMI